VLVQEAQNTQARLESEVNRVADADLYQRQKDADADAYALIKAAEAQAQIAAQEATAKRLRAEADADAIRVAGEARAAAIRAEAEALAQNQEALLAQRALEALVPMMAEFAKGYDKVGSVTVLGGEGASGHLAAESATGLRASFDAVRAATGIDLTAIIQGRAVGEALADAAHRDGTAPSAPAASAPEA
jgi:flotillin